MQSLRWIPTISRLAAAAAFGVRVVSFIGA